MNDKKFQIGQNSTIKKNQKKCEFLNLFIDDL